MTTEAIHEEDHPLTAQEARFQEEDSQGTTGRPVPKDLEAALTLLGKSDDTSRFVGLALLKPVLEDELKDGKNASEKEARALVQRCWDALPGTFIDRLLKAQANDKRSKGEADDMVGLAVAVLYAFMTLLNSPHRDEKFISRIPHLKKVLRVCPKKTREQIMNIFHVIALTPEGCSAVFQSNFEGDIPDQKPESYLFITMLLIDVRSTIPSLHEKLHTEEYAATSERLCKAYDLVSAFVGFLIRSVDSMSANEDLLPTAPMPVDLLLKLRANISETMSLTIEHLRDRYDSSTAGAAGLHPSVRMPTNPSSSTPLPITWSTPDSLPSDPLTLSQLRTLSLWLRDDENPSLHKEAAGITDVLLALYQHSGNGSGGEQDFRSPVLVAFEGILQTDEGVEVFLQENGWAILAKDLTNIITTTSPAPKSHAALGIEIVRILLIIVESPLAGPAKDEWMGLVLLAQRSLITLKPIPTMELPIAIAQLAVALLSTAPTRLRRRYRTSAQALVSIGRGLLVKRDGLSGDDREGLEEVVEGLEGVGVLDE